MKTKTITLNINIVELDPWREFPPELLDEVFAEASKSDIEGGDDWTELGVEVLGVVENKLRSVLSIRTELAEIARDHAEEAAEIAARTPEQWAAEVTRLEQRLNDYKAECPNDECFEQASFEREIAAAKAKAATV